MTQTVTLPKELEWDEHVDEKLHPILYLAGQLGKAQARIERLEEQVQLLMDKEG